MSTEEDPRLALVPGVRYALELEDCCIQGNLSAVFLRYELDEGEPYKAVFDIGTIGPMWGQWTAVVAP